MEKSKAKKKKKRKKAKQKKRKKKEKEKKIESPNTTFIYRSLENYGARLASCRVSVSLYLRVSMIGAFFLSPFLSLSKRAFAVQQPYSMDVTRGRARYVWSSKHCPLVNGTPLFFGASRRVASLFPPSSCRFYCPVITHLPHPSIICLCSPELIRRSHRLSYPHRSSSRGNDEFPASR